MTLSLVDTVITTCGCALRPRFWHQHVNMMSKDWTITWAYTTSLFCCPVVLANIVTVGGNLQCTFGWAARDRTCLCHEGKMAMLNRNKVGSLFFMTRSSCVWSEIYINLNLRSPCCWFWWTCNFGEFSIHVSILTILFSFSCHCL
jgi:hypothetical protein